MLGTDLVRLLEESGQDTVAVDVNEMDIRSFDSVNALAQKIRPSVIINAAAITDVDGCESMVQEALLVNGEGPSNLAKAARNAGAFLVHLSTDYVFDGKKRTPYVEDDPMRPLGAYGKSKALGETRVRETIPEDHCIVRTQWLFGPHGKNFVETILSLASKQDVIRVVNDQSGTPTYSPDLSAAILTLCRVRGRGTFHVTNSGETTWYDFAARIVKRSGASTHVEPMSSKELNRPAPRPLYAALDNSRFIAIAGSPLRRWEEALDDYLEKRKERIAGSPDAIAAATG
jgi:dTDP-4-dehydrorhamnose reductase